MADLTGWQEAGCKGVSFWARVREDGPRQGHFLLLIFRGFKLILILRPFLAVSFRCSHFPLVPSTLFHPRHVETGSLLVGRPDSHPGHALGFSEKIRTPQSLPSTQCTPGLSPLSTLPVSDDEAGVCFNKDSPQCHPFGPGPAFPLSLRWSLPASRPVLHSTSTPSHWRVSLPVTHISHHRSPLLSHALGLLGLSMATSSRFYSYGTSEGQRCPSVVRLLCAHRSVLCNHGCS